MAIYPSQTRKREKKFAASIQSSKLDTSLEKAFQTVGQRNTNDTKQNSGRRFHEEETYCDITNTFSKVEDENRRYSNGISVSTTKKSNRNPIFDNCDEQDRLVDELVTSNTKISKSSCETKIVGREPHVKVEILNNYPGIYTSDVKVRGKLNSAMTKIEKRNSTMPVELHRKTIAINEERSRKIKSWNGYSIDPVEPVELCTQEGFPVPTRFRTEENNIKDSTLESYTASDESKLTTIECEQNISTIPIWKLDSGSPEDDTRQKEIDKSFRETQELHENIESKDVLHYGNNDNIVINRSNDYILPCSNEELFLRNHCENLAEYLNNQVGLCYEDLIGEDIDWNNFGISQQELSSIDDSHNLQDEGVYCDIKKAFPTTDSANQEYSDGDLSCPKNDSYIFTDVFKEQDRPIDEWVMSNTKLQNSTFDNKIVEREPRTNVESSKKKYKCNFHDDRKRFKHHQICFHYDKDKNYIKCPGNYTFGMTEGLKLESAMTVSGELDSAMPVELESNGNAINRERNFKRRGENGCSIKPMEICEQEDLNVPTFFTKEEVQINELSLEGNKDCDNFSLISSEFIENMLTIPIWSLDSGSPQEDTRQKEIDNSFKDTQQVHENLEQQVISNDECNKSEVLEINNGHFLPFRDALLLLRNRCEQIAEYSSNQGGLCYENIFAGDSDRNKSDISQQDFLSRDDNQKSQDKEACCETKQIVSIAEDDYQEHVEGDLKSPENESYILNNFFEEQIRPKDEMIMSDTHLVKSCFDTEKVEREPQTKDKSTNKQTNPNFHDNLKRFHNHRNPFQRDKGEKCDKFPGNDRLETTVRGTLELEMTRRGELDSTMPVELYTKGKATNGEGNLQLSSENGCSISPIGFCARKGSTVPTMFKTGEINIFELPIEADMVCDESTVISTAITENMLTIPIWSFDSGSPQEDTRQKEIVKISKDAPEVREYLTSKDVVHYLNNENKVRIRNNDYILPFTRAQLYLRNCGENVAAFLNNQGGLCHEIITEEDFDRNNFAVLGQDISYGDDRLNSDSLSSYTHKQNKIFTLTSPGTSYKYLKLVPIENKFCPTTKPSRIKSDVLVRMDDTCSITDKEVIKSQKSRKNTTTRMHNTYVGKKEQLFENDLFQFEEMLIYKRRFLPETISQCKILNQHNFDAYTECSTSQNILKKQSSFLLAINEVTIDLKLDDELTKENIRRPRLRWWNHWLQRPGFRPADTILQLFPYYRQDYYQGVQHVQMNQEESRILYLCCLLRLRNYQGNASLIRLAQNGFYHEAQRGPCSTRCYLCGWEYSEWDYFDDIQATHRRLSPICPWLDQSARGGWDIAQADFANYHFRELPENEGRFLNGRDSIAADSTTENSRHENGDRETGSNSFRLSDFTPQHRKEKPQCKTDTQEAGQSSKEDESSTEGFTQLKKTVEEIRRRQTCKICLDQLVNMVLLPCGHWICSSCAQRISKCHICRKMIRSFWRVF